MDPGTKVVMRQKEFGDPETGLLFVFPYPFYLAITRVLKNSCELNRSVVFPVSS